jgi:glycosyltransferase involved in cell wall biosynthesis
VNHQHHPTLTVVIPVWDRFVDVLEEAIASIDAQRSEIAMRILVIDNASEQPHPRLRPGVELHRLTERVSVGAARNAGLDKFATPFVAFTDADDLLPLVEARHRPTLVLSPRSPRRA